jgi:hypothetical protein
MLREKAFSLRNQMEDDKVPPGGFGLSSGIKRPIGTTTVDIIPNMRIFEVQVTCHVDILATSDWLNAHAPISVYLRIRVTVPDPMHLR